MEKKLRVKLQTKDANMQKIIEFKKKSFWSSKVNISELNDKITALNSEGWMVKSITPTANFLGITLSYTLLVELAK